MSKVFKGLSRYVSEYLSTKVVFVLDLFVLLMSSFAVITFATILGQNDSFAWDFWVLWLSSCLFCSALMLYLSKSYRIIIRHATLRDIFMYGMVAIGKVLLMGLFLAIAGRLSITVSYMLVIDLVVSGIFILALRLMMILAYDAVKRRVRDDRRRKRVLVYGLSDKSFSTVSRLQNSPHYNIVGFVTREKKTDSFRLAEKPVYSFEDDKSFLSILVDKNIDALLFASDSDARLENDSLLKLCGREGVDVLITPTINEVVEGHMMESRVRAIKIEDLLGRPEIKIPTGEVLGTFRNKVVMVTGSAGSIGSELCRQLAGLSVKKIILYDNSETPMHNLRLELEELYPELDFVPVIGDVRQLSRLDYAFSKWHPQIVFHAAAYKHVPLMEENPCEAVLVNVAGSRNVADKCIEYGVDEMIMVSTDKAVNPTNIMGCTKRIAEIYVQSLGLAVANGQIKGKTKFVTTRFGNVLGSNGSVIPRFREQIEKGGPLTVTHPEITRFFMTIPEACRLVMEAATMTSGNQIFVFDMGVPVKIDYLARRMIELSGLVPDKDIKIMYTGLRPGEKLYEELLSDKENTLPTANERIRIAQVREYDYSEVALALDELEKLSRNVDICNMVCRMKALVPEFVSKNSCFEVYDKERKTEE